MGRSTLGAIALALVLVSPAGAGAESNEAMAAAARAFRASLGPDAEGEASFPFASPERSDVHFAPFNLDGAELGELTPEARSLGATLLAVSLSAEGVDRVREIRELERDVRAREEEGLFGFATSWMRDPGRYFWAFFGDPSAETPWGFRLEGHHLSLNVTALPGEPAASTPLFLGAQPRVVPAGLPSAGVAVLGREEQLARSLFASLAEPERYAATLPYDDDRGLMIGQVGRIEPQKPQGVARSALDEEQRALLDALVDRFAALFAEPIAAARRAEIAAAREQLHFAFVASDTPPNAYYVRVSGPGVLIEIDNTSDGDHVHAVWHRPGADFGEDRLAQHWRAEHGVAWRR